MILHLYAECDRYLVGTLPHAPREKKAVCRGLATGRASDDRRDGRRSTQSPYIVAYRRRGAQSIVTFLGGILT